MGYNKAQDALIKAFKDSVIIDKKALYLFFLKENTTHSDIKGHMPFNRQFGFVYAANQSITELTHTMAHELGHGAFRLKHTFSNENEFVQNQGQTPNIMDYASGSELLKYQWDECHDFDLGCNWFEDGDEAEMVSMSCFKDPTLKTIFEKNFFAMLKDDLFRFIVKDINKSGIGYCVREALPGDNMNKSERGLVINEQLPFFKSSIILMSDVITNNEKLTINEEFFHAYQRIKGYKKNENGAKVEVEAKMFSFYLLYKNMNSEDRKNQLKVHTLMGEDFEVFFGHNYYEKGLPYKDNYGVLSLYFETKMMKKPIGKDLEKEYRKLLRSYAVDELYEHYKEEFSLETAKLYNGETPLLDDIK